MASKLTAADLAIIRKAQKASDNFNALDEMKKNTALMVDLTPKLIKLVNKTSSLDSRLQIRIDKLTKEVLKLKLENQRLKDGGELLSRKIRKSHIKEQTKRHQYWKENLQPDLLN